jgi:hypothetical protein
MTTAAMLFMAGSWIFVLGLMLWSFNKILRHQAHHDPDSIGPAQPPEPPMTERRP